MLLRLLLVHVVTVFAQQAFFPQPDSFSNVEWTTRIEAVKHDAPYISNSLLHLLRQWGTTLAPNGFSYTYATIPAHTLLYHARKWNDAPTSPEWLSFTSEMSLGIMLNNWGETFLRVYVSNRSLKVLLIDGMSAALSTKGTLDSQTVLLYGETRSDWRTIWDEYGRADQLCSWANKNGIEGFVRANAGFELLWCDFDVGVELVQNLNVSDWFTIVTGEPRRDFPWGPGRPPPPTERHPGKRPTGTPMTGPPFTEVLAWEWYRIATDVYSGEGEERVILDTSRFVTAYGEPGLTNHLNTSKMDKHRLTNMTADAVSFYRSEIARISNSSSSSSGIEWRRLVDTISVRYSRRLPEIRAHLVNGTDAALERARLVAIGLLMPFIRVNGTLEENLRRCTRAYTTSVDVESLAWSEQKLLVTVETVHGRICNSLLQFYDDTRSNGDWRMQNTRWKEEFMSLEKWLDWKAWKACREVCKPSEVCYIPIWPVGRHTLDRRKHKEEEPEEPFCANIDWYMSP